MRLEAALLDEVLAGAEGLVASAGDDGNPQARLTVEPVEDGICFPLRGVGKGVHGFGTVDGYDEDIGCWVGEDVGWVGRR